MPEVKILEVTQVGADFIVMTVEYDIETDTGTKLQENISLQKISYCVWKADNPGGNVLDYLEWYFKNRYQQLMAMTTIGKEVEGKTLSW